MPELIIQDWGLISYDRSRSLQEELLKEIVDQKLLNRDRVSQPVSQNKAGEILAREPDELIQPPSFLIFCQHPNVYTLGNSGVKENLLLSEAELEEQGIEYFHIRRGGDITYHGPGQLVGYPILDLDQFFTDIHKYLRLLEEAIIITLSHYSISAGRISGLTGVWVNFETIQQARKIAAIGVRCSRWVTMHGFALNVNTDLSYFGNIIPCGIRDKAVTSMEKELGRNVDIKEVQTVFLKNFQEIFGLPFATLK